MELINAIIAFDYIKLAIDIAMTIFGFIVIAGVFNGAFGGGASESVNCDDEDDEYENASWNPGSVNYNG